jgi:serralysin
VEPQEFINQVVELTNLERAKLGLAPLSFNPQLAQAAQTQSQNMALEDFVDHIDPRGQNVGDRVRVTGYPFTTVTENIAWGYNTPEGVVSGWMNSPNHRVNILDPNISEIGVGYFFLADDTGVNNFNTYWTQVFANPIAQPTSQILPDNTLLNSFQSLTATANASLNFFDLTDGNDRAQLTPENTLNHPGGVRSFSGDDLVTGSNGSDVINGNAGNDQLNGNGSNDYLRGGRDNDVVNGGDGNDVVNGSLGNDIVNGDNGNDVVRGGRGADIVTGGEGNDILIGDVDTDVLTGGGGNDTFVFRVATDLVNDIALVDRVTDFTAGDRVAIAGNIDPSTILLQGTGGNTLIMTNTGDFLGLIDNTAPEALNGAVIVVTNDAALNIG